MRAEKSVRWMTAVINRPRVEQILEENKIRFVDEREETRSSLVRLSSSRLTQKNRFGVHFVRSDDVCRKLLLKLSQLPLFTPKQLHPQQIQRKAFLKGSQIKFVKKIILAIKAHKNCRIKMCTLQGCCPRLLASLCVFSA